MNDHEQLRQLNDAYICASLDSDVAWYSEHLADDFVCIDSDATVLDKSAFLQMIGKGSDHGPRTAALVA